MHHEPIIGFTAVDDVRIVFADSAGVVTAGLALVAGETCDIAIRIRTDSGLYDAGPAGVSSVRVEARVPGIVAVDPGASVGKLRLRALTADSTEVRVLISSPATPLYVSGWIPVAVHEPIEVHALWLYSGSSTRPYVEYDQDPYGPWALYLKEGDAPDTLRIQFRQDLQGWVPIPERLLGPSARCEVVAVPSGIVRADFAPGERFRFSLRGTAAGLVDLVIRLRRGDHVLYTSGSIKCKVTPEDSAWWDGFGGGNSPNGTVRHIVSWRGGIVAAGDFTQAGTVPPTESRVGTASNGRRWETAR